MNFSFKVLAKDKKTGARVGEIETPHGKIKTPVFVPVGTQATVKSLTPQELKEVGVQVFFVNTYHMYLRPGVKIIQKLGGLHKFMSWDGPIMSDSGGFQVFSLARALERALGARGAHKFLRNEPFVPHKNFVGDLSAPFVDLVRIDNDGVTFKSHWDGSTHRFAPEKSIEIQQKLGADLILAFDECAPYPTTYEYGRRAMERTHKWALRSLAAFNKQKGNLQALFGVVQGSVYKDLRIESAKFISSLPFVGIAIGGMAVGESKEKMYQALDWIMSYLPKDKPRHLLGVGEIDDIFEIIGKGVDMFDCVMPTRLGRMGHVLSLEGASPPRRAFRQSRTSTKVSDGAAPPEFHFDITKSIFTEDPRPIEKGCYCFTCQNFSRAYLNHLFRVNELLAYRLATIHNLYFVSNLVEEIKKAILKGKFLELKRRWLV